MEILAASHRPLLTHCSSVPSEFFSAPVFFSTMKRNSQAVFFGENLGVILAMIHQLRVNFKIAFR